jgi:hypothetical protein
MEHATNGATHGSKAARKPARKANADAMIRKVYVSRADEFLMLAIALQSATYRLRCARGEVRAYEAEMRAILKAENDRLDAERSNAKF